MFHHHIRNTENNNSLVINSFKLDNYTNKLKKAQENLEKLKKTNIKKDIAASVLEKSEYSSYKAKLDTKGIGVTAKDSKQAR